MKQAAMRVVGLMGYAQSGKDAFASRLVERHGFERLAFADGVRQALYALNPVITVKRDPRDTSGNTVTLIRLSAIVDSIGWDKAKVDYPEVRALQQRMGTDVARTLWSGSFWTDLVRSKMDPGGNYVLTDCRFQNEAEMVQSLGGLLIRIVRPGVGPVNTHISDTGIGDLPHDMVINNDGSLDELLAQADALASGF